MKKNKGRKNKGRKKRTQIPKYGENSIWDVANRGNRCNKDNTKVNTQKNVRLVPVLTACGEDTIFVPEIEYKPPANPRINKPSSAKIKERGNEKERTNNKTEKEE